MSRRPLFGKAMTGAQRLARHREKRSAEMRARVVVPTFGCVMPSGFGISAERVAAVAPEYAQEIAAAAAAADRADAADAEDDEG
jgi:hypothetical protein